MFTSTALPCEFKIAMIYTLPNRPWTYPSMPIHRSLTNDQVKEVGTVVANMCYQYHIYNNYHDRIAIFTDGSKSEEGFGSSFFHSEL